MYNTKQSILSKNVLSVKLDVLAFEMNLDNPLLLLPDQISLQLEEIRIHLLSRQYNLKKMNKKKEIGCTYKC